MFTKNKRVLKLVQFNEKDILGLIELSASVNWDYDEYEIGTVLTSGNIFGHKNAVGKIVSSAAIIPYESKLASIGMVIVNRDFRGFGLGREATQKCIESVSKNRSIMLIATEEGKPLYKKMGFTTIDYVHKYLCDNFTITDTLNHTSVKIKTFSENDFTEVVKLDEAAFGDRRSQFLKNRITQAEKCLVVKDNDGAIVGYGMSILGPVNLILGPIVAPDAQIAVLLIDNLCARHHGKLRIDVPSGNEDFMSFLEKRGFVKVSQPPIMIINSDNMPTRNNTYFGIAAQIFG